MWIYYKILFPILSRNLSVRIVNRRYLVELPIKLCSSFFLFAEQPWIIKNIRWQKAETKAVINFIRIRRNVFIFKQNVCNRFTHVIINYRYLNAFKISCKTASRVKNSVSVFAQLSSVAFSASLFSDLNWASSAAQATIAILWKEIRPVSVPINFVLW